MPDQTKFDYLLRLGDNVLILGQRLGEWCGHGPVLEQDIALTNIALDLIGQARMWLAYAAEVEGNGRDEDQLAFLRDVGAFRNVLLVEQPNEDFAHTLVRQFLFDTFHYHLLEELLQSTDERIRAIAEKSIKEAAYHQRHSSEWMIRLGDGTEISHQKMQTALDDLWMYCGEPLTADAVDVEAARAGYGVDLDKIRPRIEAKIGDILRQATLEQPADDWMQSGGKRGIHSEYLGFILTEMQWMQRTYPNQQW